MTLATTGKNALTLKLAAIALAVGSLFAAGSIASTTADSAASTTNAACLHCWI